MAKITIDKESCKECGLCMAVCPKQILRKSVTASNSQGYFPVEVTDPEKCIGCAFCATMCPDCVITVGR